MTVELP